MAISVAPVKNLSIIEPDRRIVQRLGFEPDTGQPTEFTPSADVCTAG